MLSGPSSIDNEESIAGFINLSEIQIFVLDEYYASYIEPMMSNFIGMVSKNENKQIRAALIYFSTVVATDVFLQLLNEYYPPYESNKAPSLQLQKQHAAYTKKLTELSQVLNNQFDFSAMVYQHTFSKTITNTKLQSLNINDKQSLVAQHFRNKIYQYLNLQYPITEFDNDFPFNNVNIANMKTFTSLTNTTKNEIDHEPVSTKLIF
ncbi:MAG TPA: hypothetical protein PLD88_13375 [Candidatus Berkiella sp.]|nr:hypothetical protein [Candidatus Berkiella sp.]